MSEEESQRKDGGLRLPPVILGPGGERAQRERVERALLAACRDRRPDLRWHVERRVKPTRQH